MIEDNEWKKTNVNKSFYDDEKIKQSKIKLIIEECQTFKNGEPKGQPYENLRTEYDKHGNKIFFVRCTAKGKEFIHNEYIYDDEHKLVVANENHWNYEKSTSFEYNDKGKLVSSRQLNLKKSLTDHKPEIDGMFDSVFEYDCNGNLVKTEIYGSGKRTTINHYDIHNKKTECLQIAEQFDEEDNRTLLTISKTEFFYNSDLFLSSYIEYDSTNTQIESGFYKIPNFINVYRKKIFNYDNNNNLTLELSFNNQGKIINYQTRKFNENNNLLNLSKYNENNECEYLENYSYDSTGKLVIEAIRDNKIGSEDDYEKFTAIYDVDNKIIQRKVYNKNGELTQEICSSYEYFE